MCQILRIHWFIKQGQKRTCTNFYCNAQNWQQKGKRKKKNANTKRGKHVWYKWNSAYEKHILPQLNDVEPSSNLITNVDIQKQKKMAYRNYVLLVLLIDFHTPLGIIFVKVLVKQSVEHLSLEFHAKLRPKINLMSLKAQIWWVWMHKSDESESTNLMSLKAQI